MTMNKQQKPKDQWPPDLSWVAYSNSQNQMPPAWNPFSKKTMWKWTALVIWLVISIIWGTISILATIIDKLGGLL